MVGWLADWFGWQRQSQGERCEQRAAVRAGCLMSVGWFGVAWLAVARRLVVDREQIEITLLPTLSGEAGFVHAAPKTPKRQKQNGQNGKTQNCKTGKRSGDISRLTSARVCPRVIFTRARAISLQASGRTHQNVVWQQSVSPKACCEAVNKARAHELVPCTRIVASHWSVLASVPATRKPTPTPLTEYEPRTHYQSRNPASHCNQSFDSTIVCWATIVLPSQSTIINRIDQHDS
jgi:hypothetical protein